MIRLSKSCHAYLQEAVQLLDQTWVYAHRWFEQDSTMFGEGQLLEYQEDTFVSQAGKRSFPCSDIIQSVISSQTRQIPICQCHQ
jgi:hypothetical protein